MIFNIHNNDNKKKHNNNDDNGNANLYQLVEQL